MYFLFCINQTYCNWMQLYRCVRLDVYTWPQLSSYTNGQFIMGAARLYRRNGNAKACTSRLLYVRIDSLSLNAKRNMPAYYLTCHG